MTETNISEILKKDGVYVSTTSGVSMHPLLRDRRDTVVIIRPEARLRKYDVALFLRGEKYVLHRVIKVTEDGYIIRGDNCVANEAVKESNVIGVLAEICRGGKDIKLCGAGYKTYSRLITFFHPLVKLKLILISKLRRKER